MNSDLAHELTTSKAGLAKMVVLSKHFEERWRERMDGEPSPETVERIMREGVVVQRPGSFVKGDGSIVRKLGIYWDTALGVIVKVDELKGMAVTVLSGGKRKSA
jgi:hypothetical protein